MIGDPMAEKFDKSGPDSGKKFQKKQPDKEADLRAHSATLADPMRAMPQSADAEKGVLGSIFVDPNSVLSNEVEKLKPDYFHMPAHRELFTVLVEMWDKSQPIDLVTLTQECADRKVLDKVGGAAFLADMATFVPSAANARYYVEILREKFLLRQIISTTTECAAMAYEGSEDVEGLIDHVEKTIFSIAGDRYRNSIRTMQEEVMEAIDMIEKLYENRGQLTGLPTGFKDLDGMTSGLHPAEMFVIAARPSMGKTAFAMNIVEHVALEAGKAVGVFSLEMSTQQLVQRLLCSVARVNLKTARDGFLSAGDFPKLTNAAAKLSKADILIDDSAGLTILELRAKARRMKAQKDISLIVVDYLQLLKSASKRAQENRQLEIAEVSNGIKALAKELAIPIIVLAQLNRNPDARAGGKPRMSDLRESGSIEQDADIIGLLVRKEVYNTDDDEAGDNSGEAELIIAKQRNGPIGDVALTFLKEFTRFVDRAYEPRGGGSGGD